MKNGSYFGIDFGTTNTSVYLYNYEHGKGAIGTGYGTNGRDITPFSSCIAISRNKDNDFKFGREVKEKINEYADDYKIVTSFKSLLGTDEEIVVNGVRYTGQKLAVLFLNYVKETVNAIRPDFDEAVFSIPVDFSARARTELLEAAKCIGIKVKGFVSESSAAYISKINDIKAFSKVMVIDFDYDTFSNIITPLITDNIFDAIGNVMKIANVSADNIDAVILAGGSSNLRPFADIILSMFGEEKIIFDDENNRYQWIVAKGAAITSAAECDFRLGDDICILLSDNEKYPVLKKDENKVGDKVENLSFSLTTDSYDAHFIFTDSTGKTRYATILANAKGYVNENFDMSVEIGKDQIARVVIKNKDMGTGYQVKSEINKLRFYYDLKDIEG